MAAGRFVIGREGFAGDLLDDLRRDDLAGPAPGGEEVDDHQALLAEGGVEVGLAVWESETSAICHPACRVRFFLWRAAGARAQSSRARAEEGDSRGQVVDALVRHGG